LPSALNRGADGLPTDVPLPDEEFHCTTVLLRSAPLRADSVTLYCAALWGTAKDVLVAVPVFFDVDSPGPWIATT
jgi:hypothetical protein